MTARHLARDTATFTRLRFKRNAMPRGTSTCEEAVIEMKATGASWRWNLSTVPTFTADAISAMFKRRAIELDDALRIIDAYAGIPIRLIDTTLPQAVELSHKQNIYAYDAYIIGCAMNQR